MSRYCSPLPNYVTCVCEYNHVPYRLRQKMLHVQSLLIESSQLSKCHYHLVLCEDGCFVYESVYNKLIWQGNYCIKVLINHLENLLKYWYYESKKNKHQIQKNEYLSLRQTYGN